PKSPHGVDVAPNGQYLSVGGKLDPHVTIYSIDKIKAAIKASDFEKKDQFGVPILKFDSVVAGRVEVGLGPLHTQYDAQGHGSISLFLDSAVAKFTLGEPYFKGDQAFKLVDKLPVNYNIGHLVTMEGDTVSPAGKYLVALNKWSIDRFPVVGTLKPQNFQLCDLTGEKMNILSDMPIGIGEPHYVQAIRADRIKAWEVYPVGTNPATMEKDPNAVADGAERVEKKGNTVEVWGTVRRSQFKPDIVRVNKGDKVVWHLTNIEVTPDATHGFSIPRYNVNVSLDPGEAVTVEFTADSQGTFAFYCTEFCSALHLEMQGWLVVAESPPAGGGGSTSERAAPADAAAGQPDAGNDGREGDSNGDKAPVPCPDGRGSGHRRPRRGRLPALPRRQSNRSGAHHQLRRRALPAVRHAHLR
ncbi:MAG: cupredoxin domain-containing protein, partial [Dehalococcoidia bacterium]|nr:cupredoxin domain-containing protein [Dehalococcoidia bacterium]